MKRKFPPIDNENILSKRPATANNKSSEATVLDFVEFVSSLTSRTTCGFKKSSGVTPKKKTSSFKRGPLVSNGTILNSFPSKNIGLQGTMSREASSSPNCLSTSQSTYTRKVLQLTHESGVQNSAMNLEFSTFYCNFNGNGPADCPVAPKSKTKDTATPSSSVASTVLWTDLYAPSTLSDMLLNCSDIENLVSWLSSWDSDAKGSDAICVDNDDREDSSSWHQSARRVERNSHRPRNLDFCYSDDSSDSSTSVKPWRSTAFLVLGPSGCGKTALVYALATKLAFKVFEINASSCRSRKDVLSQCSALIGSQHVSTESLSTSFTSFEMAKEHFRKAEEKKKSRPKSSRPSIANFFQTSAKKLSSSSSSLSGRTDHRKSVVPKTSNEGLKLNNKSLVLFDEVDVLFESDRGFWSAVGSLLQMGRRPILMTASDPSVVDTIPIPFRVCNLRPLKITAVEAFLRKICSREKRVINPVLPNLLSSLQSSEAFLEQSGRRTLDARLLATTDHFHDIRRALNEANFYSHSPAPSSAVDYVQASKKATNARDRDLLDSFIERFPALLSLTIPSVRPLPTESSSTMKVDSQADVFNGIFDSEADYVEPSRSSSTKGRENQSPEKPVQRDLPANFVRLPAKKCRQIASDCLECLASACDMQSLIDVLHASAVRRLHSTAAQIADEFLQRSDILSREAQKSGLSTAAPSPAPTPSVGSYNTTSTSFATCLSCLGDACDTLTGIDPLGRRSAFRGEGTWRDLTSLVFGKKMEYLKSVLLPALPSSSPGANFAGYCQGGCIQPDLTCAKTTASQSLSCMDSMRQNPNVPLALGLRETSQDYLPSLRTIARLEGDRRCCSAQRRFFHYFDKIGLSEEIRANLSS